MLSLFRYRLGPLFYFDRKSRLLPGIETAVERMHIRPTVIQ